MLIIYWPIFGNYFTEVHSDHRTYPRAAVLASSIACHPADEPSMGWWFVPGTINQGD